ncbi:MAG TPA: hypothetical protein VJK02_23435 [Anaerolineales bacterium]|nr:hypothetical protein [Anaerolineales bacterium]
MRRAVAAALWLVLSAASCKPGTDGDRTIGPPPTVSPTPEATPSVPGQVTSSPTPTSATPQAPFAEPRSPSHQLLFTLTTAGEQTLYVYEVERGNAVPLYMLPTEISLHEQPVDSALIDPNTLEPIQGLNALWMSLAPDGSTLATLQPATGGLPNYVHQLNVTTGEITSIRILDEYRWTIPPVPGRIPRIEAPTQDRISDWDDASDVFQGFAWAPDSSGFVFVLGAFDLEEPEPTQVYYVKRGASAAVPLGAEANTITVGESPRWSPDGRYLHYLGDPLALVFGMWVIDISEPDVPVQIVDDQPDGTPVWAADSRSIYAQLDSEPVAGEVAHSLFELAIPSRGQRELLRVVTSDEVRVSLSSGHVSRDGKWLLVRESHSIPEDPAVPGSRYVHDPLGSSLHYLNLETGEDIELLRGEAISSFSTSPADDWLRLQYDDLGVCAVVRLPDLGTIIEPTAELCDATEWSSDGHLLAGQVDLVGPPVIYDLDAQARVTLEDGLEGEVIYLGWRPLSLP